MQDHCRSCQGAGVVKGNREVRVDIPAGKCLMQAHFCCTSVQLFFQHIILNYKDCVRILSKSVQVISSLHWRLHSSSDFCSSLRSD